MPMLQPHFLATMLLLPAAFLTILTLAPSVVGHGRLMDPPARNSMWRLGFPNPVNYNDNELYCGGRMTQWGRNKGKCGVCGDPHHHTNKEHEVGGKYANGIISRQYKQGGVIEATVHITANHKGYFEFRICSVVDSKVEVTQECLDQHVLEMVNENGTRFTLPEGKSNTFFNVSLRLPADMTCKQCVIQWKYRTGNSWDKDESGRFCVGCGPQEEFYNCADVQIHPRDWNETKVITGQVSKKAETIKNAERDNEQKNGEIMKKAESSHDKITDYGKQKLNFYLKLQPNQFSPWSEQKKLNPADVAQIGSGMRFGYVDDEFSNSKQATKTGSMASQPSRVTYRWKNGKSNNPDLEKIRQRFGYASTSIKTNGNYLRNHSNQNQPQYLTTGYHTDAQTRISPQNELGHERNYKNDQALPKKHSGLEIYPSRQPPHEAVTVEPSTHPSLDNPEIKLRSNIKINSHERDGFLKRWKQLRLRHIAAVRALNASKSSMLSSLKGFMEHPKTRSSSHVISSSLSGQPKSRFSSQAISSSPNKQKNQSKIRFAPKAISSSPNKQMNQPKTRFSPKAISSSPNKQMNQPKTRFSPKAISSSPNKQMNQPKTRFSPKAISSSPNKQMNQPKTRFLPKTISSNLNELINQQKIRYPLQSDRYHDISIKQSTRPLTSTPLPASEQSYFDENRTINHISPPQPRSSPKTSSNTAMENSRQMYLKKKLPSWLVKALRLKQQVTDKSLDRRTSDNTIDITSSDIDNRVKVRSNQENETPKWYDRVKNTKKLISENIKKANVLDDKKHVEKATNNNIRLSGMTARHNGSSTFEKTNLQRSIQPDGSTLKMKDDKAVNQNKDNNKDDTESLVRYIVKLLFSRKNSEEVNKPISKSITSGLDSSANVRTKDTFSFGSSLRDKTTSGYSWFVPVHSDVGSVSRMDLENGDRRDYLSAYPAQKYGSFKGGAAKTEQMRNDENSDVPSERAEMNPYNGFILGSDYGYGQGQILNDVEVNRQDGLDGSSNAHVKSAGDNHAYQQQQHQPQNGMMNSQTNGFSENKNDHHHVWTSRAQNRQSYYDRQQEATRSPLICKSLVALGGGMDQWCMNNCNANFCPPSMCICRTESSSLSVYASPTSSEQTYQNDHSITSMDESSKNGFYRNPGYYSKSSGYLGASGSLRENKQTAMYSPAKNEKSNFEPYIVSPSAQMTQRDQTFTRNIGENRNKNKLYSVNLISSGSNHIQEQPRTTNSQEILDTDLGHSTNTERFVSEYSDMMHGGRLGFITESDTGFVQAGMPEPRRSYYGNIQAHLRSPSYIGDSNVNNGFKQFHKNTEAPLDSSWLSNYRNSHNRLETQPKDGGFNDKQARMVDPYPNVHDPRQENNISPNARFSQNNNGKTVGQNQFYPQFEHQIWEDVPRRLKCKAIGAYGGLKHFDEWCAMTCHSTMCPLLICSCES